MLCKYHKQYLNVLVAKNRKRLRRLINSLVKSKEHQLCFWAYKNKYFKNNNNQPMASFSATLGYNAWSATSTLGWRGVRLLVELPYSAYYMNKTIAAGMYCGTSFELMLSVLSLIPILAHSLLNGSLIMGFWRSFSLCNSIFWCCLIPYYYFLVCWSRSSSILSSLWRTGIALL